MAPPFDKRARRRWLRAAGARLGAGIIGTVGRSVRLTTFGEERAMAAVNRAGGGIFAFWHGRFWLPASRFGHLGCAVLVSLSEDGEVIARAARRLGFHPVRGSSSRRGSEGLRDLEACLDRGLTAALTPDGPRGPRHVAQVGTVVLAARSGKPILPLGAAARPRWTLRSWDRFQVPLPGSRGVVVFEEPLVVPAAETDLEPWRRRLEAALNRAEAAADERVGG